MHIVDRIWNEYMRSNLGVTDITEKVKENIDEDSLEMLRDEI